MFFFSAILVVVSVAGTGLNEKLKKFPEITTQILSDFKMAATNVDWELSRLKNESLALTVQTIERHIEAMAPLISEAIWDSVSGLVKAGVVALEEMGKGQCNVFPAGDL
jgi:hypothetical protein